MPRRAVQELLYHASRSMTLNIYAQPVSNVRREAKLPECFPDGERGHPKGVILIWTVERFGFMR
jgi:hypothetical protein